MATCRDCVGYNFCSRNRDGLTDYYGENSACDNVENLCCTFQNKSDFQEVKHGKLNNIVDFGNRICVGYCSNCGTEHRNVNLTALKLSYRYCRWCGAKMDGGKSG